jgi:hypothetical protein
LAGSAVGRLVWVIWNSEAWTKPLTPGGWYLTPTSYCSPSLGRSGWPKALVTSCGWKERA